MLVRATGFDPPSLDGDKTGDSQIRFGRIVGAPDGIRTHGPQIRNLVLYPAELRAPRRLLSRALGSRQTVRPESVGFTGRRDRKRQRRNFDALFEKFHCFLDGRLSVDRLRLGLAIMHGARFFGEAVADPV